MHVRSQPYILLFAMLTKRKTIISKSIFSLFFLLRSVFFLVVRLGIIHLNSFYSEKERKRIPTFYFKSSFCKHVNIFRIRLLSIQIDILRRYSCYFHIIYSWIVSDFGFFLWSVSYLPSIVTTSGMS